MGLIPVPWDAVTACLSAQAVLKWREYERLFLSSFEHADDNHLYYNMLSFIVKGKSLESRFGSLYFAYLLTIFTVLTNITYVALQVILCELTHDNHYYKSCAIGFSGVIFALKVLTTHFSERCYQRYFGIRVSDKYAVWIELLIIQLMVPNASFTGHLAGIIIGVLYTQGPLKFLMDLPIQLLSLFSVSGANQPVNTNWGSGVSGTSHASSLDADADYDEAVSRSYAVLQQESEGREQAMRRLDGVTEEDYDEAVRRSYESLQENHGSPLPDIDEIRRRRLSGFT